MLSPDAKIDTQVYLCVASGRQCKTFKHSKGKTKYLCVCVCVCVCVCMQKKHYSPSRVQLFVTPSIVISVHGILQARILQWVALPFSRESSWPRNRTQVSRIAGRFFTVWATSKLTFMYDGGGLVAKSCPTPVTPWTIAYQTPLSMGVGCHFLLQGIFSTRDQTHVSYIESGAFTTEP